MNIFSFVQPISTSRKIVLASNTEMFILLLKRVKSANYLSKKKMKVFYFFNKKFIR